MSGAGIALPSSLGDEMIEKSAGPRRVVQGEYFRTLRYESPERAKKLGAAFEVRTGDFDR